MPILQVITLVQRDGRRTALHALPTPRQARPRKHAQRLCLADGASLEVEALAVDDSPRPAPPTAVPGPYLLDVRLQTVHIPIVEFRVARNPDTERLVLTKPAEVVALTRRLLPDDAREHFGAFFLDAQNGFVAYHEVAVGTLTAALVHPREIFGPALRIMGVASVILVHSHPSGDPTPSNTDLRLTRQAKVAAELGDLILHDHIILGLGTGSYVSLAETGKL